MLLLGVVAAAIWMGAWIIDTPPVYAEYRQTRTQIIPGTWEIVLQPLPAAYEPKISLERALQIGAGRTPRDQIMKSLAIVSSNVAYVVDGKETRFGPTPSWVLVARGLCYASDKGELVSSSRRGANYTPRRCTLNNVAVLALDADTGEYVLSGEGYDPSAAWRPANAANLDTGSPTPQLVFVPGSRPSSALPVPDSPTAEPTPTG